MTEELIFPPVDGAEEGIVALGGDLSTKRLLLAYRSGIFPWYGKDEPIIWWSPDPRFVLFPPELKVSESMQRLFRKKAFQVTYDTVFTQVIEYCSTVTRKGQKDTWITDEMKTAYIEFHKKGYAHSVEVWQEDKLVGGMYGVILGKCFFGESMFHTVDNASKYGFITFVRKLQEEKFAMVDCQVHTGHLESLGARYIDRNAFLSILKKHIS